MDELTEDELHGLRASSRPWHRLPDSCNHNGYPLYLKTYIEADNNVLVSILTDIRSSVWLEYFGDARSLYLRIKASSRETPQSTYTDLKEKEAVSKLFSDMDVYPDTQDGQAIIESKSDSEMELVLPLPGIQFRLRLDKVSPEAQSRLLYELVYLPLLGIANALQHSDANALQALQHDIDQESKAKSTGMDSILLSAVQRCSQGASGVPLKSREPILSQSAVMKGSASRATASPKKPESKQPTNTVKSVEETEEDGDQTMLSSPEPETTKSVRSPPKTRQKTASPLSARNTRAATREESSISPSPPSSVRSKRKGKARHIAESPEDDGDSDATQSSNGVAHTAVDDEPAKGFEKVKAKESSPEKAETPLEPEPARKKVKASTPPPRETSHPLSSPHGPILKRPAVATARGMPPKRGKKLGMQWSNFG